MARQVQLVTAEMKKLNKEFLEMVASSKTNKAEAKKLFDFIKGESTKTVTALNALVTVLEKQRDVLKNTNSQLEKDQKIIDEVSQSVFKNVKERKQLVNTLKAQNETQKLVKGSTAQLQAEVKKLEAEYKRTVTATNKNSTASQELAKKISVTKARVNELGSSLKATNRTFDSSKGSYNDLVKQNARMVAILKKLPPEFVKTNKRAKELQATIKSNTAQLSKFDSAIGRSFRNVGNYQSALKGARGGLLNLASGLGLTVGGLFILGQGLRDAFSIIKTFQKESAVLAGVLDKTRDKISDLTEDAKRLGSVTAKTATEVTSLQIAYARLGFSQEEILNLTESTINGSIALNSELDETAELVGAIVRTFDDFSSKDAPKIIDQITLSTQKSALNFEKLKTAIPTVAGAANVAGIPFTKLIALLGKLSDSGIDASSSATALRNIFIDSKSQGLSYEQILDKISKSTDKLTASNDEFGKRTAVSSSILSKNLQGIKALDKALQSAGGTADRVALEQLNTLTGSLSLLRSAWEGFILSLEDGNGVLSTFINNWIKGVATIINKLTPALTKTEKAAQDTAKALLEELGNDEIPRRIELYNDVIQRNIKSIEKQNSLIKNSSLNIEDTLAAKDNVEELTERNKVFIRVVELLGDSYVKVESKSKKAGKVVSGVTDTIKTLQAELSRLQASKLDIPVEQTGRIAAANDEIEKLQDRIQELNDLSNNGGSINLPKVSFDTSSLDGKDFGSSILEPLQNLDIGELDISDKINDIFNNIANNETQSLRNRLQALKDFSKGREDIIEGSAEQIEAIETELREKVLEGILVGLSAVSTLQGEFAENARVRRDNELFDLEQKRDADLLAAGDNERAKDEISRKFAAKEKQLKIEQAERDKKQAVFSILLNTASAVVQALPNVGLSIAVGAIGLAQGAITAAREIPAFEKGSEGKEITGKALVNERFSTRGSEIFKQGNDIFKINSDGPTIMDFKTPTQIIGYDEMSQIENDGLLYSKVANYPVIQNNFNTKGIERKLDSLNANIKKVSSSINITQNGVKSSYMIRQGARYNIHL